MKPFNSMNQGWIVPCALVALASLAPSSSAYVVRQDPPKADDPKAPAKPVERWTAWPKPADKDQLLTDIERVCKAQTADMAKLGSEALIAAGGAGVPFVLERYGRERDEGAQDRLKDVLLATTTAEQTRLLAKEFSNKLLPVRTFALWRASYFPDPELRKDADAAWARIAKQATKADPDERYAAALCAASTGSIVGFEALWDATLNKWDKTRVEVRAALNGARGKEASALAWAKLTDTADRKLKVAVLRMLAGVGDKDSAPRVKGFLDEEDNAIRVAAINALRGILDNELPLEGLSAFEAIEMAKKWKSR
jgi:hypothetical protein